MFTEREKLMVAEIARLEKALQRCLEPLDLSPAAWRYTDSAGDLYYTNNPNEVWNDDNTFNITVLYEVLFND